KLDWDDKDVTTMMPVVRLAADQKDEFDKPLPGVGNWPAANWKVDTAPSAYSGAAKGNKPFYGVGSDYLYVGNGTYDLKKAEQKLKDQMTHTSPELSMKVKVEAAMATPVELSRSTAPSLVLQRLANIYLPEQPDPTQPNYNPFITID